MSCSSGLTSVLMTAAGSFVTNGTLADTFGAAPLSSLSGVPLSLADAATGLTNFAPTLNTMITGIAAITGAGAPLAGLSTALSAIEGAGFTSDMISAFNAIPTDLGIGGGLVDAIGGFAPGINDVLTTASGGAGVLNDALTYATSWSGQTIGGSGSLVGGVLTGDPSKFGTILNTASSYVTSANQFINAATNSSGFATTFTDLNNIVSGGIGGVNLDFGGFGEEIAKLGGTISWSSLENLGNPGQLLSNLTQQGTLGPLYDKLNSINIDSRVAAQLGVDIGNFTGSLPLGDLGLDLNAIAQQGANMPVALQKEVYNVLDNLDLDEVQDVKAILANTQDSIVKGSDLLDPKKLFPKSFETFTAPLRTASVGFRAIYENETGSVNSQFNNLGNGLSDVVPEDIAVANGALARSLLQIKNIKQTGTTDLADAVSNLESLKDLDLLENQSSYVTNAVSNYWLSQYGTSGNVTVATGNAGQLQLSDIIGFAAGYNSAAPITKNAQLLSTMAAAGELNAITGSQGVYDTIEEFCAGTFGPTEVAPGDWQVVITAGYLGVGTYSDTTEEAAFEDAWVNGIVPAIKTVLASYTSNTRAVEIMSNSERWSEQLAREYINQGRIDNQDLTAVRASDDVAINLALNLPTLGLDINEGGTGELLERIVDFSSLGGQSVIAAMREGRNLNKLAEANILLDSNIDTTGVANVGTITVGQYTSQEAKNQIIKS